MNKLKVNIKTQYMSTRYVEGFINHHRILMVFRPWDEWR